VLHGGSGVDGGLHPWGQHLVVGRDERLLHVIPAFCCDIVVSLSKACLNFF
jgi:hypothetical protein